MIRRVMDVYEDEDAYIPDKISVDPGPMPSNLYKIGFWRSIYRIVFPPSEPILHQIEMMSKSDHKSKYE